MHAANGALGEVLKRDALFATLGSCAAMVAARKALGRGDMMKEYKFDASILSLVAVALSSLACINSCEEDYESETYDAATPAVEGRLLDCTFFTANDVLEDTSIGVDYQVPSRCGLIKIDKPVTIKAGVTIRFEPRSGLLVREKGALRVEGTKSKPVLLTSLDQFRGSYLEPGWRGITIDRNSQGNVLEYLTMIDAGDVSSRNHNPTPEMIEEGTPPASLEVYEGAQLTMRHVTISRSRGVGVLAQEEGISLDLQDVSFQSVFGGMLYIADYLMPEITKGILPPPSDGHKASLSVIGTDAGTEGLWPDWHAIFYVPKPLKVVPGKRWTLPPGASLEFGAKGQIVVPKTSSCVWQGTVDERITFLANVRPAPGVRATTTNLVPWQGILIDSASSENLIEFVKIEDAGAKERVETNKRGAIELGEGASLTLKNSIISGSRGHGVFAPYDGTTLRLERNQIKSSARAPLLISPSNVAGLDATSEFVSNADNEVVVSTGRVEQERLWPNLGIPYTIQGMIEVSSGGLTLGEGVQMNFVKDAGIRVTGGYLKAEGTAAKSVQMKGEEEDEGWRGLYFTTDHPNNELTYVDMRYAGGRAFDGSGAQGGVVLGLGGGVRMKNVVVLDTTTFGLRAMYGAKRLEMEAVSVLRSEFEPLMMPPEFVAGLGKSNRFEGNGQDVIRVVAQEGVPHITMDTTWPDAKVPYAIQGIVAVRKDATLTVEQGAHLQFAPGSGMEFRDTARLKVSGTREALVRLEGQIKDPGSWKGIRLFSQSTERHEVLGAVIANAGGGVWGDNEYRGALVLEKGADLWVKDSSFEGLGLDTACAIFKASDQSVLEESDNDFSMVPQASCGP